MNNPLENVIELKLVKYGISLIVFFLVSIFCLALMLFIVHTLDLEKSTSLIIILSFIAVPFFLLLKPDTFFVKYKTEIAFKDDGFILNNTKYYWKDVEWYKSNAGSKLVMGFAIGILGKKTIKLYSTTKSGEELNAWIDTVETFESIISLKSIQTRNYYATRFWRTIAILILSSNLVVPVVLFIFDINNQTMIPIILAWVFISLPYPIVIFMNQEKG